MSLYLLQSPNGRFTLRIALEGGALSYTVMKDGVEAAAAAPIGAVLSTADLTCGLSAGNPVRGSIEESYTLPAFKKSRCENHCNTLSLPLEKDGVALTLEARAYDDGAAFRLCFLGDATVQKETTGFALPDSAKNLYGMKHRFSYEDEYHRIPRSELAQNLLAFPVLVEAASGVWALWTEASVYSDYGPSLLRATPESPTLLRVAPSPDEFTELKAPVSTPWRVVLAGTLDDIVNSNTLENLNPPSTLEDESFIQPGMVAWSWMTENESPADFNRQKDYIDFAAEMGWPYALDDGGWRQANVDIPALVAYGKEKGVGIWVWEHRRALSDPKVAEETLALWASWGVVGVKIDFFESDSRERMAQYEMLADLCAKFRLMVNFHGCTKPAGEMRRWPHVLTREGVLGAENFQNYSTCYPFGPTASYNCILPFTRNVLGPMDYTPVNYGTYLTGTTDAHQTALSVVFTSYLCHVGESPEVVREHPCSAFLKHLPTAWDESRLLEGEPECFVTMARRKGEDWYVGSICASRPRTVTLSLDFLGEGAYTATLYQDELGDLQSFDVSIGALPDAKPEVFEAWESITSRPCLHQHDIHRAKITTIPVTASTVLEIPCVQNGGFALKLQKQ